MKMTETKRLCWMVAHSAVVVSGSRMITRCGGLNGSNLEDVWQCEWETERGDLIMQTPDCGHKTWRDAIDAAIRDSD